jgi:hypothetical protein
MKNYLVKTLFKVNDTNWLFKDRKEEGDIFAYYMQAHELSLRSYNKFLKPDFEFKFYSGTVDNINEAFRNTFWLIHDLWHSESCNILYTDPDTMAIKPVNPWHYHKFMMFNYTYPKSLKIDGQVLVEHFFNAGVRYFPSTMTDYTWGLGRNLAANWNKSSYHTEQLILNNMLWSQGLKVEQALDKSMNWSLFVNMDRNVSDEFNQTDIDTAKILHFHASRDIKMVVKIMDDLFAQLN